MQVVCQPVMFGYTLTTHEPTFKENYIRASERSWHWQNKSFLKKFNRVDPPKKISDLKLHALELLILKGGDLSSLLRSTC